MRSTGKSDKNGKEIFEGNTLKGKTINGDTADFKVRWSDYRNSFIGDCPDEIYDISPTVFNQYEIV